MLPVSRSADPLSERRFVGEEHHSDRVLARGEDHAVAFHAAKRGVKQRLNALLPGNMELGDVLVLLIALLLLIDGEEDTQTLLIAMAAFFLL